MKIPEIERLTRPERRRFLKLMGLALGAPAVPSALRFAANELVGGVAHAQGMEAELPTNFIEINLRDQWDHGHFFVAPGLATHSGLRRGTTGQAAAIFYEPNELRAFPNNVYLTRDSAILEPHLDTIAMIDCCELSKGAIHGHEAANALRTPGRDYGRRPGTMPVFQNDPVANFPQGCEEFYSSTPTPASLHNFVAKGREPGLRNAIAFKGISRSIHTAYHFAAGLAGAELDRIQSKASLFQAFPDRTEDLSILPRQQDADALVSVLERIDRRYLLAQRFAPAAKDSHQAKLREAKLLLYSGASRTISLPLTPEEARYWSEGVPDQSCEPGASKAQIWEQVAYAYKIIASGLRRTVALEFDYVDVHDQRTEDQMRVECRQAAIPLARLIEQLKAANLYDSTLVAIYTTDGSRSPGAGSAGTEGKNTIILAGGMIRGGYYGDVRVAGDAGNGHVYAYHAPDLATGAIGPGFTDNRGRVPGAEVWRTVMRALRVPDSVCDQFPTVQSVSPLDFLLRA